MNIKAITLAISAVAVVSSATAVGLMNAELQAAKAEQTNVQLLQAEKEELEASVSNLVNIVCDNADESWRPMCEDHEWSLVVDEVYEQEGIILTNEEIWAE